MAFKIGTLAITMVLLFAGGWIASFILPIFGFGITGYTGGFFVALIQVLALAMVGLLIKFDVWTLLLGAVLILVGGIIGGLCAEYFGAQDIVALIVTLAIQSGLLMFLGVIKGSGKRIV